MLAIPRWIPGWCRLMLTAFPGSGCHLHASCVLKLFCPPHTHIEIQMWLHILHSLILLLCPLPPFLPHMNWGPSRKGVYRRRVFGVWVIFVVVGSWVFFFLLFFWAKESHRQGCPGSWVPPTSAFQVLGSLCPSDSVALQTSLTMASKEALVVVTRSTAFFPLRRKWGVSPELAWPGLFFQWRSPQRPWNTKAVVEVMMVVNLTHTILFFRYQNVWKKYKNKIKYTHNVLLWLEELHKILKEELLVFLGLLNSKKKNMFFRYCHYYVDWEPRILHRIIYSLHWSRILSFILSNTVF